MNFFSFFNYLNREVFTQDASYLPDTEKQGVIDKLKTFFEKYFGIGGSSAFIESEHRTAIHDMNSQETLSMVAEPNIPYGKQS